MNFLITDHGVIKVSEYPLELLNSDRLVYEVIRIIDGIPLFLEDHFSRLQKSMEILEIASKMEYPVFRNRIAELIKLNRKKEGNIKFTYSTSENENQWVFTFIPHIYPAPEDYINGVTTELLFAERKNPNAKVIQNTVREKADQMISDKNIYEVLLVDHTGQITEGSRSNVFYVKDEVFYTAPALKVLEGITRQKVFMCLNELSFQVIEEAVRADDISRFDAVFLTGTSPNVLPVRSIGNQVFDTQQSCVKKLMDSYNELITRYIQNKKGIEKNN